MDSALAHVLAFHQLQVATVLIYGSPQQQRAWLRRTTDENGWWGNAACAASYEGLAWVTGAAVMAGGAMPEARSLLLALLYSLGAHGIMTLNDFKSIDGDRRTGVGSLPVRLGADRACRVACAFMIAPQVAVVLLLFAWRSPAHAAAVAGLVVGQIVLMRRLLADPVRQAAWYSACGVTLFVIGMLVSAFALAS